MTQHDSHVRTWRLWNEFLMRPGVLAKAFSHWMAEGCRGGCDAIPILTEDDVFESEFG